MEGKNLPPLLRSDLQSKIDLGTKTSRNRQSSEVLGSGGGMLAKLRLAAAVV